VEGGYGDDIEQVLCKVLVMSVEALECQMGGPAGAVGTNTSGKDVQHEVRPSPAWRRKVPQERRAMSLTAPEQHIENLQIVKFEGLGLILV